MAKPVMTINLTQADVNNVFGDYDIDQDSLNILYHICQSNYGLRGAVNVYVNTAAVFERITAENLTKIMRDMNIGA